MVLCLKGIVNLSVDLHHRGIKNTGLVVSDELSGIENAIAESYPQAHHQLCLIHKLRNLLIRVRASEKKVYGLKFSGI